MRSYEFILNESIERRKSKPYYALHDKKSADRARIRSQARKERIENTGHRIFYGDGLLSFDTFSASFLDC